MAENYWMAENYRMGEGRVASNQPQPTPHPFREGRANTRDAALSSLRPDLYFCGPSLAPLETMGVSLRHLSWPVNLRFNPLRDGRCP
jgi:hypothetical protein